MNSVKTAIKSFFKSLDLENNPADNIHIKTVRVERDFTDQQGVHKLLNGINNCRDKTIISLLCFLGL